MATLLFMPDTGTAPASPAYDAVWDEIANAARVPLLTSRSGTPTTNVFINKVSTVNPTDGLARQFVSAPLPAGSVSGTAKLVNSGSESTGSRNAFMQCVIRVVSGDGSTVRGTLYAGQTTTVASATTTDPAFEFALFNPRVRVLPMTLSSVVAQAGDRLVVEVGVRACNANAYTNSVSLRFGDGVLDAAMPETVDYQSTNDEHPWIEFSQDLFSAAATPTLTLGGTLTAPSWTVVGAFAIDSIGDPATLDLAGQTTAPIWGPVVAAFQFVPNTAADLDLDATISSPTWDVVAAFAFAPVVDDALLALDSTVAAPAWVLSAAFAIDAGDPAIPPSESDTTIRNGGRDRTGYAVAVWEPAVVPAPASAALNHRRVGAAAFGPVSMVGTQPTYTVSQATTPRTRTRILMGDRDVSFYRDVPTPEPSYTLAEPLLWGPCTIEFPQIAATFETPGKGALRWCRKGAPVKLQRVTDEGAVVERDYWGVVVGHDVSGPTLRVEVGGHAQGRAALRHRPVPIFRQVNDLGWLAWEAINSLGLRFEPRLGPTTGIRQGNFGGSDFLTYISEVCAKAWQRDGTQWTIMPTDAGAYKMRRKDTETIDFTVFTDDTQNVASLRSDAAEEPNRIFATGTTPKGQRVRFGVYPNLRPGKPAPYPFEDDSPFWVGTMDSDTDTGDGVTVMLKRLWTGGYISLEAGDPSDGYTMLVSRAVMGVQADAELAQTGEMNPATWRALFDIDTTGYHLRGARVEPAAQASRVRRFKRSANGQIVGKNPNHNPQALVVDRDVDFGSGFWREQMREWSRAEIARGEDNWIGTVTIRTGAVLAGDVPVGATITDADLMDVRAIKPGMNASLPVFGSGITVHVSAVEIGREEGGHPTATLTVDTQARDAMTVWDIIRRNRETRRDPARRWTGNRASGEIKDAVSEWDEIGGVLSGDRELVAGWNIIEGIVGGQEGTVSRIRLELADAREFACAVSGRKITRARLEHLVPHPLAAPKSPGDDEDGDPLPAVGGSRAWEKNRAALERAGIIYSAGTREEPCGYSPGRKRWKSVTAEGHNPEYKPDADENDTGTDDTEFVTVTTQEAFGTVTGKHVDDAGFAYRCDGHNLLYLAVWVNKPTTLKDGRVMWNQLEAGA